MASATDVQAPVRKLFPFVHRPNTLDRDRIVVPIGWDSWGKISVLRDGFDAKAWGEAWERDLEGETETGAKRLYANLVPDQGSKVRNNTFRQIYGFELIGDVLQPPALPPFNNPIPEQGFLAKNYDENSKKPDRDPREAFKKVADLPGTAAGVVGPLGSSSFSLPGVEKALNEMETAGTGRDVSTSATADAARRMAARAPAATGRAALGGIGGAVSPTSLSSARSPISPSAAGAGASAGGAGQTQHEVLQNFFQSLLSTKDRGASATTARQKPNGASNPPPADEGA